MRRMLALVLAAAGLACACGTTAASSNQPPTCQSNADCRAGTSCQFAVYGSCGAPGFCIAQADAVACVAQTACDCQGVTRATCLINGNAPTPIASLGSCDGAVQQPIGGLDAAITPDATSAADAQTPDTGSDALGAIDSGPDTSGSGVDAAEAGAPTLGTACNFNSDCTDPYFNLCRSVPPGSSKICTAQCLVDSNCRPPANAVCDPSGYCLP